MTIKYEPGDEPNCTCNMAGEYGQHSQSTTYRQHDPKCPAYIYKTDCTAEIKAERERIAKAGADFFQNGDFDSWKSPTGRVFDDLGNGWQVGYDLIMRIIEGPVADDIPICPDCIQGKHNNCDGTSWNNTKDKPAGCPCDLKYHGVSNG